MKHIKCLIKFPLTIVFLLVVAVLLIPATFCMVVAEVAGCRGEFYLFDAIENTFGKWKEL